ncbi:aldo/keto reductase [Paucilactobacillus suebicus]|uniref:Aldo keto reductase n=1 Tax=Paucilactobacillus suebicus DSM 5007 = KCTC 3549 TaxID=1423807 RepID=A0A0R1W8D0_9LACO|nr:aldo/keto reductase [Paucilactobacillus suebicus]KRM11430.1 aldo keto reductase [Paucilactobacillus suebicus DSM 5007 = KCTC 3549]
MTELQIPKIKFNDGLEIPQVGLGVFQMDDFEETKQSVLNALKVGYRHIDTASFYDNEEAVGAALAETDVPREQIFVTTKLWSNVRGYDNVKAQFKTSLKKLGLDYLDLYLIHWPAPGYEEVWRAFEDLHDEGLIKSIGVSNFTDAQLDNLLKGARITPVIDQIETHPYLQQDNMHQYLADHNIVHEAWSPLGGGSNNVLSNDKVNEIAEKYGKSAAQVVLRWHLQRGEVIIPKSTHLEQIEQNIDLFDFALTDDDMATIKTLNKNLRVGPVPDDPAWLKESMKFGNQAEQAALHDN